MIRSLTESLKNPVGKKKSKSGTVARARKMRK
jgi:hypothetical protein